MRWICLFALSFLACDPNTAHGGDVVCTKNPVVTNAQAGVHGAACSKSADCKYGTCYFAPMQLAGHVTPSVGVCSKDCSCGSSTSQCSIDDDEANALHFTCIKAPSGAGSECAIGCKTLDDCTKVNPVFTACTASSKAFSTGIKVCTIE